MSTDLHDPVFAICDLLRLVPEQVLRLELTPSEATATVARLDENGSKYIDEETGRVAVDVHRFKVKT